MGQAPLKKTVVERKRNGLKLVRSARFDNIIKTLDIRVTINDSHFEILNISESGLSFICDPHDSPINMSFDKITVMSRRNDKIIYEGAADIVWKNDEDKAVSHGLAFRSGLLKQDFIKALEHSEHIATEMDMHFQDYLAIPKDFKNLVFEIKNYLSFFKSKIDQLEKTLDIQSPETKKSYIEALNVHVIPSAVKTLKNYNVKLNEFLFLLKDATTRKTVLEFFRAELNQYYLLGPYSNRALQKPLGYAGDYEMMNQLYRNEMEGQTLFGQIMHKYGVSEFASESVRFRKTMLKEKIKEFAKNSDHFVVASIASGPAKEIVDLINEIDAEEINKFKFILIDQDLDALLDARRGIYTALLNRKASCQVECLPLSVKDIIEGSDAWKSVADKINFIYTAGLYDYLTQPVAKMLSSELYSRLQSGGKLLIGNFHPRNPTRAICEFAVDWRLIYRTEEEMMDLMPHIKSSSKSLVFDTQEIDVFLIVKKD